MSHRQQVASWFTRWGFATLVALAGLVALVVSATVALPSDIPGVALQAAPVYRIEVGGAIFIGLYLAAMSFALALQNRAFTEIGTAGVRAETLGEMPQSLIIQERALEILSDKLDAMRDLLDERESERDD